MKKIIFAQVLTTNGTTEFSGLYDENGKAYADWNMIADSSEDIYNGNGEVDE